MSYSHVVQSLIKCGKWDSVMWYSLNIMLLSRFEHNRSQKRVAKMKRFACEKYIFHNIYYSIDYKIRILCKRDFLHWKNTWLSTPFPKFWVFCHLVPSNHSECGFIKFLKLHIKIKLKKLSKMTWEISKLT